jgi:hypothetical protein
MIFDDLSWSGNILYFLPGWVRLDDFSWFIMIMISHDFPRFFMIWYLILPCTLIIKNPELEILHVDVFWWSETILYLIFKNHQFMILFFLVFSMIFHDHSTNHDKSWLHDLTLMTFHVLWWSDHENYRCFSWSEIMIRVNDLLVIFDDWSWSIIKNHQVMISISTGLDKLWVLVLGEFWHEGHTKLMSWSMDLRTK